MIARGHPSKTSDLNGGPHMPPSSPKSEGGMGGIEALFRCPLEKIFAPPPPPPPVGLNCPEHMPL